MKRAFPEWDYRVPDPNDTRIADLGRALLEQNDDAALHARALALACEDYNTTDSERSDPVSPDWYLARAKEPYVCV